MFVLYDTANPIIAPFLHTLPRHDSLTISLAAEPHLGARPVAHAGRLYLDDIGAHVAQQHAAERAGHDLADIEDSNIGKWKIHASAMPSRSEENTSELQSRMRISYVVLFFKK